MNDYIVVYEILSDVYKRQAYASISLSRRICLAQNREFVTRFVYGVLQDDVKLNYYISCLTSKKPQNSVTVLLKMGMYCIGSMDSVPDYASVNNILDLAKELGKAGSCGFLNGVLKNFCRQTPAPPKEKAARLSVTASVPLWIVRAYIKQYGFEKTEAFLTAVPDEREHMRINTELISVAGMKDKLDAAGAEYDDDPEFDDCLFVRNSPALKGMFDEGLFTYQSKCSMRCCKTAEVKDGAKVLDMCAAPGGKAVYISAMAKDVSVTACDIYHHRLDLIQAYARRMRRKLDIRLMDATVANKAFFGAFDVVMCDVPCSNLGVAAKKPDVYLFKEQSQIFGLAQEQYRILCNGARYVKAGGDVIYSTCTLLKEENGYVVKRFIKEHRKYKLVESRQYFPDGEGSDGFFVAKIKRTEE